MIQLPASYYNYNHHLPFDWQEVICLQAQGNYTIFVFEEKPQYISTKTLESYELHLPPNFLRINKSCIVRREYIVRIAKKSKVVYFSDGRFAKIARRRWTFFKKYAGQEISTL
ncbi:MAG: LytTR family transcriptional regulator [Cytophagia bacterium]|nr:MAG: LytTR family transcriptional regulator [Cytophagales bacterium]TAG38176.1 MAG: LytTR family transcriptional regulator [Cytophagia bacterium]